MVQKKKNNNGKCPHCFIKKKNKYLKLFSNFYNNIMYTVSRYIYHWNELTKYLS